MELQHLCELNDQEHFVKITSMVEMALPFAILHLLKVSPRLEQCLNEVLPALNFILFLD